MSVELSPADEQARLAAVRRYDVLDTPPDGAFERITAVAARLFGVPISIVSIVDADRIWFKSHHGLDVEEIVREPGLCASAILQADPWLVTDARSDPRTLANPLVAGEFGLRFYAGVPLTTHDGFNLGTLCVIDREPRQPSEADLATLADLASVVMDELELRLAARRTHSLQAQLRRHAEEVASSLQESLLPPRLPDIPGLQLQARYHAAYADQVGGDFYDVFPCEGGYAMVIGDACGKGAQAAALTGTARWALRTAALDTWTPAQALGQLNRVLVRASEAPDRYLTLAVASLAVDPAGGATVSVSLAGHPHPLVLRADGGVEPVGDTGPIAGWSADAAFTDTSTTLLPGDTLVMFTDGVLDALGGRGSADDPLRAALATCAGATAEGVAAEAMTAEGVADCLEDAVTSRQLTDDAAFLVVRVQ